MKLHFLKPFAAPMMILSGALGLCSCINTYGNLGETFVPESMRYKTFASGEIPIEDISLSLADSLTGYSQERITFGATRDEILGLCKRGCALTMVPIYDTVDFGENAKLKKFRFHISRDTTSLVDPSQRNILQSIYVYELSHSLDSTYDINQELDVDRSRRICNTIPIFNGITDTIAFDFTTEFGNKYLQTLSSLPDSIWSDMPAYLKLLPGIYIETDEPMGYGGRINIFNLQLGFDYTYGYISSSYAQMDFSADFDGVRKDTSCLFYFSPDDFYFADSLLYYTGEGDLPQYCLNVASHESRALVGKAKERLYMEGGGGISPLISSRKLKKLMYDEIAKNGDPEKAIINKATLSFYFDGSEDFKELDVFPLIMNPTARIKSSEGVYSYASLTNTTEATASMGTIDRSNMKYHPDITYHAQSILGLSDTSSYYSNYDVRFLVMNSEVVDDSESASESYEEDYYNQLMYASYYNNMYGSGGYGYGGYGGYGYDSYNSNYYNYMMYASMYGSGTSTVETEIVLDKDRYYKAVLNGPEAPDPAKRPSLKLIYSLPLDDK